ncbi:MAG: hypothetical protein N2Z60_03505 [Elusimicrobiales bacterium]|nr:hypothetical protein [Elusimicrobiales bacterium]
MTNYGGSYIVVSPMACVYIRVSALGATFEDKIKYAIKLRKEKYDYERDLTLVYNGEKEQYRISKDGKISIQEFNEYYFWLYRDDISEDKLRVFLTPDELFKIRQKLIEMDKEEQITFLNEMVEKNRIIKNIKISDNYYIYEYPPLGYFRTYLVDYDFKKAKRCIMDVFEVILIKKELWLVFDGKKYFLGEDKILKEVDSVPETKN